MKCQRYLILADRLNRCIEYDLRTLNLCAVGLEKTGDVSGGHGSKQLPNFACLTQHHIGPTVEFFTEFTGLALHLEIAGLKLGLHFFESLPIVSSGAKGFAPWQQEVTGEAVLHTHNVAHMSELSNSLEQDHFHFSYSSI